MESARKKRAILPQPSAAKMVDFLQGCDLAIMDTQYTDEEYAKHIGWGHSSVEQRRFARARSNVGKLLLFHHDPNHDDEMIDKMVEHARALVAKSGKPLEVEAAREGAEILLGAKTARLKLKGPRAAASATRRSTCSPQRGKSVLIFSARCLVV